MYEPPLITVVTVSYNAKSDLEVTIKSVIEQDYSKIEYLIIDGGSSDGTIEVLRKYNENITFWVSEYDDGLYHAMNKAIKISNGDWIIFLNAGDIFHSQSTVGNFARILNDKATTYFGRANVLAPKSQFLYPGVEFRNIKRWLKNNVPNHQSMFFPRSFYSENLYDTNYVYFSDADYKYRSKIYTALSFKDEIVVDFKLGGISSRYKNMNTLARQSVEVFRYANNNVGIFFALKRCIGYILTILSFHISTVLAKDRK